MMRYYEEQTVYTVAPSRSERTPYDCGMLMLAEQQPAARPAAEHMTSGRNK